MSANNMIGLSRLIKARQQGYKPAGWVWVDVGSIGYQRLLRTPLMDGKTPRMIALWDISDENPGGLHVLAHPGESVRLADWSWCIGLKVQVDGDDPVRVEAAHERIRAAGAERVVSSCAVGDSVVMLDSMIREVAA